MNTIEGQESVKQILALMEQIKTKMSIRQELNQDDLLLQDIVKTFDEQRNKMIALQATTLDVH